MYSIVYEHLDSSKCGVLWIVLCFLYMSFDLYVYSFLLGYTYCKIVHSEKILPNNFPKKFEQHALPLGVHESSFCSILVFLSFHFGHLGSFSNYTSYKFPLHVSPWWLRRSNAFSYMYLFLFSFFFEDIGNFSSFLICLFLLLIGVIYALYAQNIENIAQIYLLSSFF